MQNRRGSSITFHPDPDIFGAQTFKPHRLMRMARSKAYLFSGVEIRWKSALPRRRHADKKPCSTSPAASPISFPTSWTKPPPIPTAPSPERSAFRPNSASPARSNGPSTGPRSKTASCKAYCNTVPTPEGGTHEAGFWNAILKGIRAYGELAKNRKVEQVTRDDILSGGCALISVFIREPQFVGQTKDRLATEEAARYVESAVRDHFDNWLAKDPKSAGAILDFLVLRAEERLRRKAEKETARKTATKRLRLPGKLADCSSKTRDGTELFLVEGDSARAAAPKPPATAKPKPCCPCAVKS